MAAIPVSLADSSICLPLQDRGIHIHMAIPFTFIEPLDPSIDRFWNGGQSGQDPSVRGRTVQPASPHLMHISRQLSRLLFGSEKRIQYSVGSCNAEDWEHLRRTNFQLPFFVGTEDVDNARILVFKADESLVQGKLHFSGEELGEEERTVWMAGWNRVKTCKGCDLYSTPLELEMLNKNKFLNEQLERREKIPSSSLGKKGSPGSVLPEDARAA